MMVRLKGKKQESRHVEINGASSRQKGVRQSQGPDEEEGKGGRVPGGSGGGRDPKAFKVFKTKAEVLAKREAGKRKAEFRKFWKRSEDWRAILKKVKTDTKLSGEHKTKVINKIIKNMMDNMYMTPAMKKAFDKKDLEKEFRKIVGALPDDDQNAANGHIDAILRKIDEERKRTQTLVDDTARLLNQANKSLGPGQIPDPVATIVVLIGILLTLFNGRKKLDT